MNRIPFLYQFKQPAICLGNVAQEHYNKGIQMNVFEDGSFVWMASKPSTNTYTQGHYNKARAPHTWISGRTDKRVGK